MDSQTSKQASNIGLLQSRQPWRPTHTWSLSVCSTVSVANANPVANPVANPKPYQDMFPSLFLAKS